MIYAALAMGAAAFKVHNDKVLAAHDGSLSPQENAFFIATCVDMGFFSLLFIFSILLLYGIKNTKRYLFLPFIVCMTVLVILMAILMLVIIIIIVTSTQIAAVFELLVVGFFTGLNLYCTLCVISHYQDLRDGRGGMRAIYRAQGTTLPHVESQPEKFSDLNNLENANFVPQYPGPPTGPAPAVDLYPAPAANLYLAGAMDAPPPYQPPAYPAESFPKAADQTVWFISSEVSSQD